MNDYGRRRLDDDTADQLLAGQPVPGMTFGELADRLSAASVETFPGELAGEEAVRAAFRAANVDRVARGSRSPISESAVAAKLRTLWVAVVAAAALSVGGVALAASTGVLPNPLAPTQPTLASTRSNDPNGKPSPSWVALCTAYFAGAGDTNQHVLANPAFAALVKAAGGAESVATFCNGLGVTATPRPRSAVQTNHPRGPTQPPTPSSHPSGQRTGLPATSHR